MLFFKRALSKKVDFYKLKTVETANLTFDAVFKGGLLLLLLITIIWISIFLYVVFYYTYVPSIEHIKSVNLQFRACGKEENNYDRGVCSFLKAHVELTKANQLFMLGQPYKITLFLEVPESEVNKSLGMFLVCGQLMDKKGVTVSMACRSAMLKYKSPLVHTLTTLALAPLYVFDILEEKQIVQVELYSSFEDDQNYPVTDIIIELKSPKIEVYSSRLQIDAHLSGLRYLMFHWPTFSASLGITFNLTVILFIAALSWWHLAGVGDEEGNELLFKKFKDRLSPVLKSEIFPRKHRDEEESKEMEVLTLKSSAESDEPQAPKKILLDLKREPSSSEA